MLIKDVFWLFQNFRFYDHVDKDCIKVSEDGQTAETMSYGSGLVVSSEPMTPGSLYQVLEAVYHANES